MKRLLLAFVALLFAASAHAQTVANPHFVDFTVSVDHMATKLDGALVLTRYEMVSTAMTQIGALMWTQDLGKPVANAAGLATVALPAAIPITPEALYTAKITSIGPDCGGVGQSACNVSSASNPFGVAGTKVPAAASNVRVR